jgi:hypothetical protein
MMAVAMARLIMPAPLRIRLSNPEREHYAFSYRFAFLLMNLVLGTGEPSDRLMKTRIARKMVGRPDTGLTFGFGLLTFFADPCQWATPAVRIT